MNAAKTLSLALLALSSAAAGAEQPLPGLLERGNQTMQSIEQSFRAKGRRSAYYLDECRPSDPSFRSKTALCWPAGVQLSALVAGTRANPARYAAPMMDFVRAIDTYWIVANGVGGFSAADHPGGPDRYYDDNAWLVLTFAEAYEVTKNQALLKRARDTMAFVLSGEDDQLGGGIFWHEQKKESKNTCINAPATVAALRLYKLTNDQSYLAAAKRLYAWTKTNLQDPKDHLYWDSKKLDGKIVDWKFTYNTALMIRAALLMHEQTKDQSYLDEAVLLAKAAEKKWYDANAGGIKDAGAFAHLLTDAWLELGQVTGDRHWLEIVSRTADFLWQKAKDPKGHYPEKWNKTSESPLDKYNLMPQASVARLYFNLADAAKRAAAKK